MTPAEILAYALVGMLAAILLACALVGAVCAVVRQVLARVRAGHEDRPSDAPDALHGWPTDIPLDDQPREIRPLPDEEWVAFVTLAHADYDAWKANHR